MKFSAHLIVSCLILTTQANADLSKHTYYPTDLQDKVDSNQIQDKELKNELYKVLSYAHLPQQNLHDTLVKNCPAQESNCYTQLKSLNYRQARSYLFGKLHLKTSSTGKHTVKDLYCNQTLGSEAGVGPMQIPDHTKMNCEHTWPQSRFNKRENSKLQKTDLHHLYPTNSRANSSRGNLIFAEVNGEPVSNICADSSRGKAIGTRTTAFEPPNSHKGNVARAVFYFSTRYRLSISEIEEGYLRQWHEMDPVDQEEKTRNEEIYKIQRNRNPFIDNPDLVSSIRDF